MTGLPPRCHQGVAPGGPGAGLLSAPDFKNSLPIGVAGIRTPGTACAAQRSGGMAGRPREASSSPGLVGAGYCLQPERQRFPLHQLSHGHRQLVLTLPTSCVLPWATQGRHERALGVTDLATRIYDVARDGLNLTDGPAGAQGPREGDPGTFCQEPPFSPLLYRLCQIQ